MNVLVIICVSRKIVSAATADDSPACDSSVSAPLRGIETTRPIITTRLLGSLISIVTEEREIFR